MAQTTLLNAYYMLMYLNSRLTRLHKNNLKRITFKKFTGIAQMQCTETVSYTHLDVYKRQGHAYRYAQFYSIWAQRNQLRLNSYRHLIRFNN